LLDRPRRFDVISGMTIAEVSVKWAQYRFMTGCS